MSIQLLSIVGVINDAIALASALTPLVKNALATGSDTVSEDDVRMARDKLAWAIDSLDAAIAEKRE